MDQAQRLPRASVIISTYNSPRALNLVLRGYRAQTEKDFEVVVADDGSRTETTDLLSQLKRESGLVIRHVWQEDDGFQKCRILNKALAVSRAEYLIFTDGDCIPRDDFVDTHLRLRQPGIFLSGAMYRLNDKVTALVDERSVDSQDLFRPAWLRQQGQPYSPKQMWKLTRSRNWSRVAEAISGAFPSWNGANSSCYRQDAIKVNGFNEAMVYGAEDMEFGLRLMNSGIKPRKVRYAAACVHLEHARSYETQEGWAHNRAVLNDSGTKGLVRLSKGVDAYLGREDEFLVR